MSDMKLSKEDQEQFTKWLVENGYSDNYASSIATFYLEGRGGKSQLKRANDLLDAYITGDVSILSPHGPRKSKPATRSDKGKSRNRRREEKRDTMVRLVPAPKYDEKLLMSILGSNMSASDQLKLIKLLTKPTTD